MKKICSKCKEELDISNFRKDKSRKDGYHPYCKECQKEYRRYNGNEQRRESDRRRSKKYREGEKGIETKRKYEATEERKQARKEYRRSDAGRVVNKKAREKRRDNGQQAEYAKKKREEDIHFRIKHYLSCRIRDVLTKQSVVKSKRTLELLGCTLEEAKQHLESQFQKGMTWENHGEWHIDHKRPCASFDLSDIKQQEECFNYKNLQPLWALDNIRKGAKLNY